MTDDLDKRRTAREHARTQETLAGLRDFRRRARASALAQGLEDPPELAALSEFERIIKSGEDPTRHEVYLLLADLTALILNLCDPRDRENVFVQLVTDLIAFRNRKPVPATVRQLRADGA